MVESTPEPHDAIGEFLHEPTVAGVQVRSDRRKRAVESLPAARSSQDVERDPPRLGALRGGQSSIPFDGDDGTAISRDGIRPAR